ncbi:Kef-type K+ transport system membrane component KefB [Flavobacterium nitrogenifigens]|uniref:Kef-type K+ transport system membrane component KefB n=2 Tax=Flavobacterium TaxID=237 RepID=A0A7W7J0B8_9FLAO|nr:MULTISPECIES: cation:proton antiporter [Flavobacterium]MBB4803442.1 Kef-type K+ transport system membrane component KefB [Flavobacterium nitrogenifigens]MBB6388753.1 Kef-type K+ transport system membrane component KefB [Flavobacterium notoginsengisoli]
MFLSIHHISLPIEDPLLKFLIELIIILCIPLLLNKIKVPHLLGLIIAGAVIGPNGFGVLSRDSSVVVTGTTGLLYIMFLAGLEIDMADFKKNKWKSILFSLYTFTVPFVLGLVGGYYVLGFSFLTSVLFASLFSSHTLIVYPMVSGLGIAKNLSVNITVGGTMITDVLSLLVLAVVVGMSQGEVGAAFWLKLSISMIVFTLIVLLVFPIIARWFFKNVEDKISQYLFVIVMIYLAALLAELAGIESIIGAFFAGLALNRLIPHTSSLMNRVEFVGNAIFIPFFLISVGMLIDFSAFIQSWETLWVAAIMLIASIGGKYFAAMLTKKTFKLTNDEGQLIFGMSSASAAATLASVMVGYNIIIGENDAGEPIRLLNDHVLNGSILLILISCTVSSFVSMASAQKIAEADKDNKVSGNSEEKENILLALNHEETVEKIVNLGLIVKTSTNKDRVFAVNVINEAENESSVKNAEKILETAVKAASAADVKLNPITRHDNDTASGISNVIKEKEITDLIIGLQGEKGFSASFGYNLYNGYLQNKNINLMVYHAVQPVSTIKKYVVLIPENAEMDAGFFHSMLRIWNIGRNSGAKMNFYGKDKTMQILKRIVKKATIEASFDIISSWEEAQQTAFDLKEDDGLIIMMANKGMHSYFAKMQEVPNLLNSRVSNNNYMLIYPFSKIEKNTAEKRAVSSHDDFAEIGKIIRNIFK